jgi:HK97 family phage portal protein
LVAWRDLFRRKAANAYDILREIGAQFISGSGKTVTRDTALRVSVAFGCGRVIANGMAQVPLKLMRASGGKRMPATQHSLYDLLARKPNPWQTSFDFRSTISWHQEFTGHAFVFVNRSSRGDILELIPLEPEAVTVKQAEDRTLTYEVRSKSGSAQTFPEATIWHLRGPSWNGWDGMDILRTAREALGLAMVTEESQATLHREGVQTSGIYSVEGKLDTKQYEELRKWLDREYRGSTKSGRAMILDRAAKWQSRQMTGVDAQHIETRRFQIEEVCRFFGVMPIMVGYSDKAATYASAEQMFLAHAVHCLSPRWTSIEQSIDAYLLTEKERADGYYADFVEEGMIRGLAKDTKDVIIGYVNGGLLTPNEGRELLDRNPDSDPDSDKLRIPVNTVNDPQQPPGGGAPPKE